MRARNIKPAIFKNELLGTADPLLTILFEGLWCEADREGRLEDRPLRLRAEIFPYRPDADVDGMLKWLTDNGFIERYDALSAKVIQVLKFAEHQRPHSNEVKSVLPPKDSRNTRPGGKSAQPRRQALRSDSLLSDSPSLIPDTLKQQRSFDAATVQGLDQIAWTDWLAYRAQRKPAIKPASMQKAAEAMAKLPNQRAAVDHSIANGYQGLIEPKVQNQTKANGHDPEAQRVYQQVIATRGANRTPRVQAALEKIGGYQRIAMRTDFDAGKIERDFCQAYTETPA